MSKLMMVSFLWSRPLRALKKEADIEKVWAQWETEWKGQKRWQNVSANEGI